MDFQYFYITVRMIYEEPYIEFWSVQIRSYEKQG